MEAGSNPFNSLASSQSLPRSCVKIHCQGYENSLAECIIYDKSRIGNRRVATVTCYDDSNAPKGEKVPVLAISSEPADSVVLWEMKGIFGLEFGSFLLFQCYFCRFN